MEREQARPDLYLHSVILSSGVVVETYEDKALVEFCDDDGVTLLLIEVPYALLAVLPGPLDNPVTYET